MPAEGWYVDGEALETYALVLESRDGWDDTPDVRGDDVTLLGRHGQVYRRKKFGSGMKSLTLAVHGVNSDGSVPAAASSQRAAYEQNLDGLLRVLSVRHRQVLVERVHADGSRRRAYCEVRNAITPADVSDSYGRVGVELTVPGAFWEDVDPTTYALPYVVTTGGTQSLEVFSLQGQTAPCSDAVVTVTGPCSSVSVRDGQTGSGFTYASALSSGQSLVVDAGAFSATVGASNVLTALTLYDAQLLEVSSAPSATRGPSVSVTAVGASAGFTVTFVTRRKWLR